MSSHLALSAPETSFSQDFKNYESGNEQVVLELPQEGPGYRCPEQGLHSTKFLVYWNHNLQARALQQDGAGGKGSNLPETKSQHKRAEDLTQKGVILQFLWEVGASPVEVRGRASEFL